VDSKVKNRSIRASPVIFLQKICLWHNSTPVFGCEVGCLFQSGVKSSEQRSQGSKIGTGVDRERIRTR